MNKVSAMLAIAKRNAAKPEGKTLARQCVEMALLMATSGLGPGFYAKAKMHKKDTPLSDVLGYMSVKQYTRRVNQLNDRLYQRCSQNKWVEKSLLTASGLPTAKPYGLLLAERGRSCQGEPLRNRDDLVRFMKSLPVGESLCFKQLESWGGLGVVMFEVSEGEHVKNVADNHILSFAGLFDFLQENSQHGWLIESRIQQSADYARYNPSSVNTYRVLVIKKDSADPEVLGGYLRVGRQDAVVDNATRGGLIFPFDCHSGKINTGFLAHDRNSEYTRHPDNDEAISGTQLSEFEAGLDLAKQSLLAVPHINFAGVDIAFSTTGPVVIELNVLPDYNGFANLSLPSKGALGG